MANHLMWFQGDAGGSYPNCDGGPEFQCPKSKRIAAEYMRDFFTLTNVVAPYFDPDNFGNMGWSHEKLKAVDVGDTLWLVLVPPKHKVIDVAIESHEANIELASLASLGGLSVDLVGSKFAEGADGVCAPVTEPLTVHASLVFPTGEAAESQFQAADVNITNSTKEWYGVGINVKALPTGGDLSGITALIAVIAHVYSYDYQLHM